MTVTIKQFVRELAVDGEDPENIAIAAQAQFPHKCASRTYVMRIIREERTNARNEEGLGLNTR